MPKRGDIVQVHYVGTLENGDEFDSSIKRGEPLEFAVGTGRVIRGWDQGILTMHVGGRSTLVIPPHLGYGYRTVGSIPSGSTLIFEVELVGIGSRSKNIFSRLWDKLRGV